MECTRTVLFPGIIRRQVSFRIYIENREISPSTCNPLLGSELPTVIQSSSGGVQLVELALFYKLCPATAGLKAGGKEIETVKVHTIFQLFEKITYVTLTYNTALLPSLLTIFARVWEGQYHRLFSCYTTATSRAPVFQQWRLNSGPSTFEPTAGRATPTTRRHDNRRIVCYSPQVSPVLCFPCTCLPAVALNFADTRLLNPILGALPILLGATTTGGLYATRHRQYWARYQYC